MSRNSSQRVKKRSGAAFEMCAFDLDGTLMRFDQTISAETNGALERLRELGVRVVLATGRRYIGAREHAGRLGFSGEDPLVCYGGSMIRSVNGETLHKNTMSVEDALEVLAWAEEHDLHARIFGDGKIVAPPTPSSALERLANFSEDEIEVVESPISWMEENREAPMRVTIIDFPDAVERWLPDAERAFSDRLFVTRSLPHYVEVGSPGGRKSAALEILCRKWEISPDFVAAFGDGENDIDMLRFAGHGVAVGGMSEAVREAADAVTDPVEEEGVARYIERYVEEREFAKEG